MENYLNSQYISIFAVFVGFALGLVTMWLLVRSRIAVSVEKGRSEIAVEFAMATERIRLLEVDRNQQIHMQEELKIETAKLRDSLDQMRDERSQLNERASRVPSLEAQNNNLLELQKHDQQEIRLLATREAEKTQSLNSVSKRLAEVEQQILDIESIRATELVASQKSNERRASLEMEASRIPMLDRKISDLESINSEIILQSANLREASGRINAELAAEQDKNTALASNLQASKSQHEIAETNVNRLNSEMAEIKTRLEAEYLHSKEKLILLDEAKEALSNQFKSVANDILEEKSKRFIEQNQTNIGQLLNPLKERISEFKTKVEEIHSKDTEQQATLKAELAQLKDLNQAMTAEAHSLATALKGQSKKQGNWGEMILSNVLDRSGLRDGKDFKREVSFSTEDGRKRPDVVIYLPQGKNLVVDAKVSLNAYTRYVNAENDLDKKQALQEHVNAVAERIQELSSRVYFDLPGLNSPEMVFMFIPIESAFVEALRADESLFQKAIEKNVLVATPTTLLTSLNIVRQLWRFEEQNAHTAELADRAGKVYKKLVSFLASMEGVGKQLDKAKESFSNAFRQLHTGPGNLINQAKEFERLGVSVQTQIPEHLASMAALELEHIPEFSENHIDEVVKTVI